MNQNEIRIELKLKTKQKLVKKIKKDKDLKR